MLDGLYAPPPVILGPLSFLPPVIIVILAIILIIFIIKSLIKFAIIVGVLILAVFILWKTGIIAF